MMPTVTIPTKKGAWRFSSVANRTDSFAPFNLTEKAPADFDSADASASMSLTLWAQRVYPPLNFSTEHCLKVMFESN
jgi:hypothetical protein